ncbi:GGDEF domain-containing protein [Acholeplasma granularum]|uniref:GGDEF domain-containing protein n=1 Tax=Acholeplasma granularum TaxID=264635 RepID=UPI00046F4731|nr:GGDEF domain-containing protein [Acholeplasma granularum]
MVNKELLKEIESRYKLDVLNDLIFADNRQVYFMFDLKQKPLMCQRIHGDLKILGISQINIIEARKLLDFIEPNNLLAEVEGKNNFIENIVNKFNTFDDELYLYVPIKKEASPLWLYVRLKRFQEQQIVLGQVVRVYNETPTNIIHYQKTYQDSLTRLFSRETLKMHMDYLKNTRNSYFMYLDIDGFKAINDKYGHQAGDKFLVDIANFFISKWEYNVLYYRLGGDEFAVYCYDHSEESIKMRAKQLVHDIENLNDITKELAISISVGIVKITDDVKDYHTLLNLGDEMMYQSKTKGKGNFTIYS